jgi:RNA polymerase sigma-70 factor (ECF subfamily)
VFFRAFRRLHTFRGDSRFSTWLYAIARNHCLNALKKRKTEPTEDSDSIPPNLLGANGADVQLAMERDQLVQSMWRLIHDTLTPTEARAWLCTTVMDCPWLSLPGS